MTSRCTVAKLALLLLSFIGCCECFLVQTQSNKVRQVSTSVNGIFDKVGNFFEELDAFVDDATSRRLGAGAAFYGKRKSNFYGKEDKGRKRDRSTPDPTEDYQGPTSTGLFQWMQDDDGQMRPVTRLKNKNIERNPQFWDRVYAGKEKK